MQPRRRTTGLNGRLLTLAVPSRCPTILSGSDLVYFGRPLSHALKPWQKLSLASLEESAFGSIVPSNGILFSHYSQPEGCRQDENFIDWFSFGPECGISICF
jgi:hypothetical protein